MGKLLKSIGFILSGSLLATSSLVSAQDPQQSISINNCGHINYLITELGECIDLTHLSILKSSPTYTPPISTANQFQATQKVESPLDVPSNIAAIPESYQYLTKENHHRWQDMARDFNPINNQSYATLNDAQSLFGQGTVIQKQGKEMQKVRWVESDRSIEGWFKTKDGSWGLVEWSSKGF